jgi:hypothetical protein
MNRTNAYAFYVLGKHLQSIVPNRQPKHIDAMVSALRAHAVLGMLIAGDFHVVLKAAKQSWRSPQRATQGLIPENR